MKKYRLPPLKLFHSFEAAARLGSFTLAANELCLTQSAISRQIKSLEDHCRVKLFRRQHRKIELTEEGRALYTAVSNGLNEISSCLSSFSSRQGFPQITVSATVAFSYFWLMPRIESFSMAHPDVDIRILATDQVIDLHHDEADVAILYGAGSWPGVNVSHLFEESVYPVCSPGFTQADPDMKLATDLLNKTLLHFEGIGNIGGVNWQSWLGAQGVDEAPSRRGIQLNSYPMILQAAQAGRGVALGWSYITDEMVRDGRLVCPIGNVLKTGQGYYVGALEKKSTRPAISAFISWMIGEAPGS